MHPIGALKAANLLCNRALPSYKRQMRILFITSTRIGDAVLSTGLLAHLIETHPGAQVTVVCGPVAENLFQGVPGLERIIVLDKKPLSLHWLEMWTKCIGQVWDMVIDLRNAPLSALLLSRRQLRLGRAAKQNRHRVISLASVLGLENNPPMPQLWTRDVDETFARDHIPDDGPVLAIGPTANWQGKVWMVERFAELALRLTSADGILPGSRIAVFAHESEREMAQPLLDALKERRTIDLVAGNDLLSVFACLKRSSLYIGNDSGLMHLAAAAKIPTLGLFGPSRDDLYAPWGEKCRAVRTPISYEEAFPPGLDTLTTKSRMGSLEVDAVEAAANALWYDVTQ